MKRSCEGETEPASHRPRTWRHLTWQASKQVSDERHPPIAQTEPPVQVMLPERLRKLGKNKPMAIELCCGHAGLTATLWDAGVETIGIDWHGNKHETVVPIAHADLTTKEGQKFVLDLMSNEYLVYIDMGPPCGTFSRAREIPIPKWLQDQKAPAPRPLRTEEQPEGIDPKFLTATERIKVEKSNEIARFCAKVAKLCLSQEIWFTIEIRRIP